MSNGVAVTPGTGVTILTDDTGATGHAQVVKLAIGTAGATTLLPADATNGLRVAHGVTGIGNGRKVVTTAGTRVALMTTTTAKSVAITAETDNTGTIVVGSAAGVIAAIATRQGIPLAAGDSMVLPCEDLADIGLDSTVSGDGVTYTYFT